MGIPASDLNRELADSEILSWASLASLASEALGCPVSDPGSPQRLGSLTAAIAGCESWNPDIVSRLGQN